MDNQKNTLIAIILMGLILLVYFSEPYQRLINPNYGQPDTTQVNPPAAWPPETTTVTPMPEETAVVTTNTMLPTNTRGDSLPEILVTVHTPLMEMTISSLGGGTLRKVYLNKYLRHDSSRVQLIPPGVDGILANHFLGYEVQDFYTDKIPAYCSLGDSTSYHIFVKDEPRKISFTMQLGSKASIERTFIFFPDSFHFDLQQKVTNLGEVNAGRWTALSWREGLALTEENTKEDIQYNKLYVLLGNDDSPSDFNAKSKPITETTTGVITWAGVRVKYFTALLIPDKPAEELWQRRQEIEIGDSLRKSYTFELRHSFDRRRPQQVYNYRIYVGPLDYDILKSYNLYLEEMMSWGWFGFIGKWCLWFFKKLYAVMPNYGLVIIIFSILVKILVAPLTKKSYASSKKMQELQPKLAALKEKYKNNPQRLNQETMKLYKEMGVNPLGGCLPMLIQMPLLFALFTLFRTTIELRGAPFVGLEWWIADLSQPDTVGHLLGIPINPLPIVMAFSMVLQQKLMSPTTGGTQQMKSMPYLMTGFFLFLFYSFPSGLNLYYTLFNFLSIIQQKFFTPATESAQ